MTTLITGGTGKTGIKLARLIHAAGHPVLLASRKGVAPSPFKAITFDWTDPATFENPFKADPNIDKVYLVAPLILDVLPVVKPFIELAISKGVKRGGVYVGKVHEYLVERGVDYTVLRPTWFIENLGEFHAQNIRENDEILSVTKDGRIPLIGTDDIAKTAYDALFATKSPNTDYFLIGPELYSYTEVRSDLSFEFNQLRRLSQAAALLSETLGRKISHRHLTNDEEIAIFQQFGISPEYAQMLNHAESLIAEGIEEVLVGQSKAITGTHKLRDFIQANKQLWIKE
ncbi:hypothetical protein NLJ89_g5429 [Agrocybe chaxingu]|uniref:Agroclavine dehydrogenase n=1 Tax=Agrocybe chaxingu TaxID=84603 RepID=A0A9W8MV07_9AGAR|nr:hypothetical protein NLJ89_g5429 [Agrocybe chaxingu]